jgi:TonB family protein
MPGVMLNNKSIHKPMKYFLSILNIFLFASSLILCNSCISPEIAGNNFYFYSNCSTASCINKGLLDETVVDTLIFHEKYSKFMSNVDTSSRTTQAVNALISKLKPELIYGLKSVILVDTGKHNFYFHIEPNGSFDITVPRPPNEVDSVALKKLVIKISSINHKFPEATGLWVSRRIELRNDNLYGDSSNVYSNARGGRSKASIMQVVMQNLRKMRYAYNRRLSAQNGIQGKITVKFAIDHYGIVIFCKVINSTVGDTLLEEVIRDQVASWKFEPILKIGDVTEVVYPFVFSQ